LFVTSANNLQAARARDALIFNLSTSADGVINFIYIEQRWKKNDVVEIKVMQWNLIVIDQMIVFE
jgi:hypothetical protein